MFCVWCGQLFNRVSPLLVILEQGDAVTDGDDKYKCCSDRCADFMIEYIENQDGGL